MADQIILAPSRALDANADPVVAARAYFYLTGTMTAATVTSATGTTLPWPLEADLNGVFPQAFYAGASALKVILTDADDVVLTTIDPAPRITTAPTEASGISFDPTDEAPASDVQGAIEALGGYAAAIAGRRVNVGGLASGGGELTADVTVTVTAATEEQARAGASTTVAMTPATTKEAIDEFAPLSKSFASGAKTITSDALLTMAHGMTIVPKLVALELRCLVAEEGYSVGDRISVGLNNSSATTTRNNYMYFDADNIYVRLSSDANCFIGANKSTGDGATLTNSSWALIVRAWA